MAPMPPKNILQTSAKAQRNPYITGLIWFTGICAVVITSTLGGAAAFDLRYAKQEKMAAVETMVIAQAAQQAAANKQLELKMEYQSDLNRKRNLEDHIFRFNMTPDKQKSQTDRAIVMKYEKEIDEMNRRWRQQGMPLK